jgi:hypothetical protein
MKRVCGHVLAGLTLLVGGDMMVSACVHDDSTLYIRDVLQNPLVSNGQVCMYTSDPTQTFIPSGILDMSLRSDYEAWFLVGNQTVPRGDPTAPKVETSRITVEGGIVRITDVMGNNLPGGSYTTSSATTVDPENGTNPGFAPVDLIALDYGTVQKYGPAGPGVSVRLITNVRVFGHTLGGQYVESNEFPFPVDLCRGCLISFSAQDIDPNLPFPNCAGAATTTMSTLPVPCIPGENDAIDCSQCLDNAACNPNVPTNIVVQRDAGAG